MAPCKLLSHTALRERLSRVKIQGHQLNIIEKKDDILTHILGSFEERYSVFKDNLVSHCETSPRDGRMLGGWGYMYLNSTLILSIWPGSEWLNQVTS